MTELWLKFKDENGEDRRVLVEGERFTVGRHSESSLSVPNEKLSRQHLNIDRDGDEFIASDAGSSNGTTLNDEDLADATALKNGDILDLGGGLRIEVEMVSDDPNAEAPKESPSVDAAESAGSSLGAPSATSASAPIGPAAPASDDGSMLKMVFLLAPLFVIAILVVVGGIVYVMRDSRTSSNDNRDENDFVYSTNRDDDEPDNDNKSRSNDVVVTKTPSNSSNRDVTATPAESNSQPTPTDLSGTGKVEQNAAAFLRKIALNDVRPFLTGDQAKAVDDKIKQLRSSTALADNIKSANRNAPQIRTLASAKNLKPQFLATAAIAKLGSSRGDVLQTAQSMAGVLDKLSTQIGNELADDSLLLIAAYDQGQAGEFMKMRNMLQDLANKSTESSRTVRTIWFLQKNNKISAGEFEFALRFLAIGTLTQNPKDFGVNTEALVF